VSPQRAVRRETCEGEGEGEDEEVEREVEAEVRERCVRERARRKQGSQLDRGAMAGRKVQKRRGRIMAALAPIQRGDRGGDRSQSSPGHLQVGVLIPPRPSWGQQPRRRELH
jgi:hypothetical protein